MLPGEKRNHLPLMLRLKDLLLNGACSFLETILEGYASQAHRVLIGCSPPSYKFYGIASFSSSSSDSSSGGRGGSDGDAGTGIRTEALCF